MKQITKAVKVAHHIKNIRYGKMKEIFKKYSSNEANMNVETHRTECPSTQSSVSLYLMHRSHQQLVKFILHI